MSDRLDELVERDADGPLPEAEAAELRALLAQAPQRAQAIAQRRTALLVAAVQGRSAATLAELVLAVDRAPSSARQIAATAMARRPAPALIRHPLRWAAGLLVALLAAGGAALLLRPAPGFDLVAARGQVTSGGRALAVGARVPFGSALELGDDAQAELRGDDGSRVELAGGTRIALSDEQGTVLRLASGALRGDIRHQPAGRPLRLVGAHALCTVLGTRLAFATGAEQDRLQVVDGLVRAERPRDRAQVEVGSGEVVDIAASGSLLTRPSGGAPPADPPAHALKQGSSLYNPNELYDVALPLRPVEYSDAQKAAQRAAGLALVKEAVAAARAGKAEYRARPGVYRLPKGADFELGGAGDFALHLADCELVLEDAAERSLFKFGKAAAFTLTGPLKVDCDPLVESQGRITASDATARTLTIAVLPGYHALAIGPKDRQSFHAYTPQGVWLPNAAYSEFAWKDATLAADGRSVTLTVNKEYRREVWAALYQVGNLVTLGNAGCATLFSIWPDQLGALTVSDVDFYGGGFGWGTATGDSALTRVRGLRRPGTNRLAGGGGWQAGRRAGRATFESCEFRTTNDDILDLSSGTMDMVWRQESPRTCVVWTSTSHHYALDQPGTAVAFYGKDFARLDGAGLVAAERVPDAEAKPWLEPAARLVKSALDFKASTDGRAFWRLTLDKDVSVAPGALVEDVANRQMEVVMRNCTWLDCGMRMMVQSGRKVEITHNHFVRVAAGVHACTDAWWWQGETVHDVLIADNVLISSCYGEQWNVNRAAICVHNGTKPIAGFPAGGYPHDRIVIRDNLIIGASTGAITVQNADHVQVTGNECRGVLGGKDTAAAIAISGCAHVQVAGNRIDGCPVPAIAATWVDGLEVGGNTASGLGTAAKPTVMVDLDHVRGGRVADNSVGGAQLAGVLRVTESPGLVLERNVARGAPGTPAVIDGSGTGDVRKKH